VLNNKQARQYERISLAEEEKIGYVVIEHFHTGQQGFRVVVCVCVGLEVGCASSCFRQILQLAHVKKMTTYPLILSLGYFLS
jgi:hypothetical protein